MNALLKYITSISTGLIILSSCSQHYVEGNGIQKIDTLFKTGTISELKMNAVCNVQLIPSTTTAVVLEGDENLHTLVKIHQEKGELIVEPNQKDVTVYDAKHPLTLKIWSPTFNKIVLAGYGNIESEGVLTANESMEIINSGTGSIKIGLIANQLNVLLSGVGNIDLNGKAQSLQISLSGSGAIDATALESMNGQLKLSGVGSAKANVSDNLEAKLSGVGSLYLTKTPATIKESINGLGSIKYLDQ